MTWIEDPTAAVRTMPELRKTTGEDVKGDWTVPRSGEEKGVIELKHDIARLQKKRQEELDQLLGDITAHVRKEFEDTFSKKFANQAESMAGFTKVLDQLNFWRKKRQAVEKERTYAETQTAREELEVEEKFIDKRIEAYSKKCERFRKKSQGELDAIRGFREKELTEFFATIKDFLLSREATEEDQQQDAEEEEEEEEDQKEMNAMAAKLSLK